MVVGNNSGGGASHATTAAAVTTAAALTLLGVCLGVLLERGRTDAKKRRAAPPPRCAAPPLVALPPPPGFGGRVVIVTGGAGGIGAGICRAFVRAGALVWCADVDEIAGAELERELRDTGGSGAGGGSLRFLRCDAASAGDIRSFCGAVLEEHPAVHVLVNNCGVQWDDGSAVDELDDATWHKVLSINLTSYFLFSKAVLPGMLNAGGDGCSIIHMASVQGLQSQPGIPAYASSKGGILSLTRQMSMDYAGRGVRVNAVCPGTIRTPLVEALLCGRGNGRESLPEALAGAASAYPLGRIGEIEDVAEGVLFLASPRASFVTGTALVIDGGIMAKGGWCGAA